VVVHGDSAGAENLRRSLSDWLNDMHVVEAAGAACFDRYIGYFEPYATSHDALDQDAAIQQEVTNAATALARHIEQRRSGLHAPDDGLTEPRPK
jgi:hypothetical protein